MKKQVMKPYANQTKTSKVSESFILETKLVPPAPKENTISRPRLISLVRQSRNKKLILITADAGYGKTTLITQIMKSQPSHCVYYGLDKGDSDLVVFFSYLVRGIARIAPGLVERSRLLLEHWDEVGKNHQLAMGTLVNELLEKRSKKLYLFLDDYHSLLSESVVHHALDYFIEYLPGTVQVVLTSRVMPRLPSIAKWRAKRDLVELSRQELAFTEQEVKQLFTKVYKVSPVTKNLS